MKIEEMRALAERRRKMADEALNKRQLDSGIAHDAMQQRWEATAEKCERLDRIIALLEKEADSREGV